MQPEAVARRARGRVEPRAVVGDGQAQQRAVRTRGEPQHAAIGARRDRIAHGVLDQRLEQHAGNARVLEPARDVLLDDEPRAEARALDREVLAQERQLVAEPRLARVRRAQRVAEHVRQPRRRRLRSGGIDADQRRDRVQRVEQEVRIDLSAQRAQLCLGELGAHRLDRARALDGLAVVHARHADAAEQRAEQQREHARRHDRPRVAEDAGDQRAVEDEGADVRADDRGRDVRGGDAPLGTLREIGRAVALDARHDEPARRPQCQSDRIRHDERRLERQRIDRPALAAVVEQAEEQRERNRPERLHPQHANEAAKGGTAGAGRIGHRDLLEWGDEASFGQPAVRREADPMNGRRGGMNGRPGGIVA
jgi:hypothetical protein